jgi:1-deoxy-D-xylulose-5-phosphate reductoisomerase
MRYAFDSMIQIPSPTRSRQRLTILGATGSIGLSTLDVVARHPERFEVFALTAHGRVSELAELCRVHRPRYAVVGDSGAAARFLHDALRAMEVNTEVLAGVEALAQVSVHADVDTVMAAIVGAAGLAPTLAAVRAGKRVLLANKEALVMAGPLFMAEVQRAGAVLLPIDSEHNAIFQSLPPHYDGSMARQGVRRLLLTASGGPFRTTPLEQLRQVTPEQACAHPKWVMGRKISVDSASMMNKGLEVIEAHWLFNAAAESIQVVIHPESVIHSLVEYVDGSVLAQLGNPDMRTPIAHALGYPERIEAGVAPLDLFAVGRLNFEPPDERRFPCLTLAYQALRAGGSAPALLNAANEVAVAAFLEGRLPFLSIADTIARVLERIPATLLPDLDSVMEADGMARRMANDLVLAAK